MQTKTAEFPRRVKHERHPKCLLYESKHLRIIATLAGLVLRPHNFEEFRSVMPAQAGIQDLQAGVQTRRAGVSFSDQQEPETAYRECREE